MLLAEAFVCAGGLRQALKGSASNPPHCVFVSIQIAVLAGKQVSCCVGSHLSHIQARLACCWATLHLRSWSASLHILPCIRTSYTRSITQGIQSTCNNAAGPWHTARVAGSSNSILWSTSTCPCTQMARHTQASHIIDRHKQPALR